MSVIFESKDAVLFVGGRGTKAGDADAGGGCTKTLWGSLHVPDKSLADIMSTNGEPLSDASAWNGSGTACTVTDDGGNCKITKAGAFSNCITGLIANVIWDPLYLPGPDCGRFEVLSVDGSGNYVIIDRAYPSADGDCDIKVGGAIPDIQTASDESTAVDYNCYILTNKAEVFSGAGDQIDTDAGGGVLGNNTWKRIIGIDDSGVEFTKDSYTMIDADNYAAHVFNIDGVGGIGFLHIHACNAGAAEAGFYFGVAGANYGFLLDECKATGGKYGVKVGGSNTRDFAIIGGYYEGSDIALYIVGIFNGTIQGVYAYSAGSYVMYVSYYGVSIQDCILASDGTAIGVRFLSTNLGLITNCLIYNVTNCIEVENATTLLVEYNNIFVVGAKATGKAINNIGGGIAYSDYSCMWAIDGAPAAADRWGGGGIPENAIEQDPQFIDAAGDDFRLELSSPCKRTGMPTLGQL